MEREFVERMERMKDDDLFKFFRRKGVSNVKAAEEIFKRLQEGRLEPNSERLRFLIDNIRTDGKLKEKAIKIKNEMAIMMVRGGFLDERGLLTILHGIDSQPILRSAIIKYFAKNENIPNDLLRKIVQRTAWSSLKEAAARRILNQDPTIEDLLVIEEGLKGSFQKKAWEEHWQIGMSNEDAVWIIGFVPVLAEPTWDKLKQENGIKDLSLAELEEIIDYTDSSKVRKEATEEKKKRYPLSNKQKGWDLFPVFY